MAWYARTVWPHTRAALLALAGVTAAYTLSLLLHDTSFLWQTVLGIGAFTATVRTLGRRVFRMHPMDALEDAANAIRVFAITLGRICLFAIPLVVALVTQNPRHT
ncbi:hypothetical protein [Streptomyces sp. NPDC060001]|uniref:hypothetical protein n=1 Tax=Streptomyces sp. NPDC060001 TaxID=3347032 RepID=UPI00368DB999